MTNAQRLYLMLADLVLIVHAAFVAFVIVGLLLIWIGRFHRWTFVRNFWFRLTHLAAIGVVAAESLSDFVCPLTTWEDRLRLLAGGQQRYEGSFIQHWLHRLIFFDCGERVFTIAYLAFFLAVALSLLACAAALAAIGARTVPRCGSRESEWGVCKLKSGSMLRS